MPNDDIPYLLKFAPKEACIDNPMYGCLHTNAATATIIYPTSWAIHWKRLYRMGWASKPTDSCRSIA